MKRVDRNTVIDIAVKEFDKYLGLKKLTYEGIIIGGAALVILEITTRLTRDVDCIFPQIPEEIKKASIEFADKNKYLNLDHKWFNNGPMSLINELPDGWRDRLQSAFDGKNLKLQTLGRADLLKTKLYAYCDRNLPDYKDLLILKPSVQELSDSISWVKLRDANPGWPDFVEKQFLVLKETLYG